MTKVIGERVAALEEWSKARDIEMKKAEISLKRLDDKIDGISEGVTALLASENQRLGAFKLGRIIVGSGIVTAIGAGAMTFWNVMVIK